MEKATRNSLNLIKLAATLLIVAYHSLGYYSRNIAWPFHGPCVDCFDTITTILFKIAISSFIFVSAFIFSYFSINSDKYDNTLKFIMKKAKHLLIPYFIWGLIQLLLFPSYMSIRTLFYGNLQLWYLAMLFNEFLLAVIFRFIWKSSRFFLDITILSFFVVAACIYCHFCASLALPFNINETILFLPVFYVGIIAGKHLEAFIIYYNKHKTWSIFVCAVSILLVILLSSSNFQRGGNIMEIAAFMFASIVPLMSVVLFSGINIKEKIEAALNTFSGLCMSIYVIHHIVIWLLLQKGELQYFFLTHVISSVLVLFMLSLSISSLFAYWIYIFRQKYASHSS